MAQCRDAALVEAVVDPGPTAGRQPDTTLPAVPGDRDQWRDMADPPEELGVGVRALPRQGERDQARVARRRFDDIRVPCGVRQAELQGPPRLPPPPPHVDRPPP